MSKFDSISTQICSISHNFKRWYISILEFAENLAVKYLSVQIAKTLLYFIHESTRVSRQTQKEIRSVEA